MENDEQKPLEMLEIVPDSKWALSQLGRAIRFLDATHQVLGSEHAETMAAGLRAVALRKVPVVKSCETCSGIESRYAVMCEACANKMCVLTPQRLVLQFNDADGLSWAACAFSTIFFPKVWGKPNTLEECEKLLDDLTSEEAVEGMMKLLNPDNVGGNGLPN